MKDNDNLNNMRRWWVRRIPGFYSYVSTLPDAAPILEKIKGRDEGKKFMMDLTDEIMGRLGHPVKTDRAALEAWKHVFGG